jgi:hypothetical protein
LDSSQSSPENRIAQHAAEMVDLAKQKKLVLRIVGSAAVLLHCPKYSYLREKFGRKIQDVDFVSHAKHASRISELFKGFGCSENVTLSAFGGGRLLFEDEKNKIHSDVFLGKLVMNHEIDFSARIEADYPTVPLAELLLSKLQIVKLNEKDIIDTILLLREHGLGESDQDTINVKRISDILSKDWGFCHTVEINIGKVNASLSSYHFLADEDKKDVAAKLKNLVSSIDKKPKSMGWKLRSRAGESIKWYEEVEEVFR